MILNDQTEKFNWISFPQNYILFFYYFNKENSTNKPMLLQKYPNHNLNTTNL